MAGYSVELDAWTAAPITELDPEGSAAVLELDWSGPEPSTVADLGAIAPLRLTHHAWTGSLAHDWQPWLLPRGWKVIGRVPLLVSESTWSHSMLWHVGLQLDLQRRWERGGRDDERPDQATVTTADLAGSHGRRPEVRNVTVEAVDELDCQAIVDAFPRAAYLSLSGPLGTLTRAGALNELTELRYLEIRNLFGMTPDDVPLPSRLSHLQAI